MDLFNKYENKFVNAFAILAERLLDGEEIKEEDFENEFFALSETDCKQSEEFYYRVMESEILFTTTKQRYVTLKNEEFFDPNINIRLFTDDERIWLKEAFNSKLSKLFFDKEELKKLKEVSDKNYYQFIDDKNIKPKYDQHLKENISILIDAIDNKTKIQYNYKKNNYISTPVKIEFDNKTHDFFAILWDGQRMIKSELEKMHDITLTDEEDTTDYSVKEAMENKKAGPVVFTVTDKRNHDAINRALETFSVYDHQIEPQEDERKHIVSLTCTIKYYSIDENDLFDDIMSFGADIQVLEPPYIIERIKDRLRNC